MLALLAVACRPLASLPSHRTENQGAAGAQSGTLVDIGGCVYLAGSLGSRYLVVWPEGYVRESNSIMDGDQHVADIGDSVTLGGGEIKVDEFSLLEEKLLTDVPSACRNDGYWYTSGLADPG